MQAGDEPVVVFGHATTLPPNQRISKSSLWQSIECRVKQNYCGTCKFNSMACINDGEAREMSFENIGSVGGFFRMVFQSYYAEIVVEAWGPSSWASDL